MPHRANRIFVFLLWLVFFPTLVLGQADDSAFASTEIPSGVIPASLQKAKDSIRLSRSSYYNPNTNRLNDVSLGCTVDFATKPELKSYSAKTKNGIVRRFLYSAEDQGVTFKLDVVEYPPEFLEARKLDIVNRPFEVLERQLDMLRNSYPESREVFGGPVVNSKYPGKEAQIVHPAGTDKNSQTYPEGLVHQRSFVREYRVYNLTVAMSKAVYERDSAQSKRTMADFIESFTLGEESMKRWLRPPTRPGSMINQKR